MNDEYVNVVGITFKKYGKKYYFDCHNLNLRKNLTVIVETERGLQFGTVITDIIKMDKKSIHYPLKSVIRVSTKKDYTNHLNNIKDAKNAYKKCNELIKKYNLDMKLVDVNYTFERTQLFFTFIANDRVDFRDLAKDLAKIYKTRIELRQIGPRDKAKEVGGLGPCGRLLCCLSYEDDTYSELKKDLPKVGDIINKDGISGKVISVDVIKKTYRIETKDKEIIELS